MKRRTTRTLARFLTLTVMFWAGPTAAAGVHLSFGPSDVTVIEGQAFTVELTVFHAGDAFNTFDAEVEFDPAHVTVVPAAVLDSQIGPLMTGACPDQFNDFVVHPDLVEITASLLCNGVTVTGPGVAYRLTFQAGNIIGPTMLSFGAATQFYNGGFSVDPLDARALTVHVVTNTGVPGGSIPALLSFEPPNPNPRVAGVPGVLTFGLPAQDRVWIELFDSRGRRVARRAPEDFSAGRHSVRWSGPELQPGAYFVRLSTTRFGMAQRIWMQLH